LLLTSSYPRFRRDAAGLFIKELVGALAEKNEKLIVVCPDDERVQKDEEEQASVTIKRFRYFFFNQWQKLAYGDGMPENLAKSYAAFLQIPFYLVSQIWTALPFLKRCKVIHAHWVIPAGLVGAFLKIVSRKKLVITIHSSDLWLLHQSKMKRSLLKWILSQADIVTTVTRSAYEALEELFDHAFMKKVQVIPMGVHENAFGQPRAVNSREDQWRILYMGRLVPIKGVDLMLEALKGDRDKEIFIMGDGFMRSELVEKAESDRTNIRFLGNLLGQRKYEVLDQADLVVFPSIQMSNGRREGIPVSLLEAMARGKAIVASDTGGFLDVLDHRSNAVLFESGNVAALKEAIQEVLSNEPLRKQIGNQAKRSALNYQWKKVAPNFLKAYTAPCS